MGRMIYDYKIKINKFVAAIINFITHIKEYKYTYVHT